MISILSAPRIPKPGLAPVRGGVARYGPRWAGPIFEKLSKSILHTRISDAKDALRSSHWGRKEDPLTFTDSESEPDVSIVAGQRQNYSAHPSTAALVIEVSVSTLAEDRAMAGIYAEAGVPEYWGGKSAGAVHRSFPPARRQRICRSNPAGIGRKCNLRGRACDRHGGFAAGLP
jgi:hypothetical protein